MLVGEARPDRVIAHGAIDHAVWGNDDRDAFPAVEKAVADPEIATRNLVDAVAVIIPPPVRGEDAFDVAFAEPEAFGQVQCVGSRFAPELAILAEIIGPERQRIVAASHLDPSIFAEIGVVPDHDQVIAVIGIKFAIIAVVDGGVVADDQRVIAGIEPDPFVERDVVAHRDQIVALVAVDPAEQGCTVTDGQRVIARLHVDVIVDGRVVADRDAVAQIFVESGIDIAVDRDVRADGQIDHPAKVDVLDIAARADVDDVAIAQFGVDLTENGAVFPDGERVLPVAHPDRVIDIVVGAEDQGVVLISHRITAAIGDAEAVSGGDGLGPAKAGHAAPVEVVGRDSRRELGAHGRVLGGEDGHRVRKVLIDLNIIGGARRGEKGVGPKRAWVDDDDVAIGNVDGA